MRTPRKTTAAAVEFVDSGSYLLNLVLGGQGWPVGRVANLVGDKSSGKTLIAVEACAQFRKVVRSADDIRYVEAERAYSSEYGKQIGMPSDVQPIDTIETVEDLFNDLQKFCAARKGTRTPSLYVVDSLDALSDKAEMERDISKGSYGAAKAAQLSELFRRQIGAIADARLTLLVISQLRDKIGVLFGERQSRSGGRALDFYSSTVTWLSEMHKLTKQVQGSKRVVGVHIRAKSKKCKVGPAFREADMVIRFNYGIDDEVSMLDYLHAHKVVPNGYDTEELFKQLHEARQKQDREWVDEINLLLRDIVREHWSTIERQLAPPMRKYE